MHRRSPVYVYIFSPHIYFVMYTYIFTLDSLSYRFKRFIGQYLNYDLFMIANGRYVFVHTKRMYVIHVVIPNTASVLPYFLQTQTQSHPPQGKGTWPGAELFATELSRCRLKFQHLNIELHCPEWRWLVNGFICDFFLLRFIFCTAFLI